uniref:Uncharacterized protein n=1 Tax=Sus scrofa TaxID=9823 RepID=A0A8D1W1L7_PIG
VCDITSYLLPISRAVPPWSKDVKKILEETSLVEDNSWPNKVIGELNRKNAEGDMAQQAGPALLVGLCPPRPPGSAARASGSAPGTAEKKDEKKEESHDNMGFGLFESCSSAHEAFVTSI